MRRENVAIGSQVIRSSVASPLEGSKRKALFDILSSLPNGSRLADVGCFDGRFMDVYLSAGVSEVDGFDVNADAIALARTRGMNATRWDFESETAPALDAAYDVVVCADVLEHIYNSENLLRECHRIVRSSGRCIFITPNLASLWNRLIVLSGRMPLDHPGVSIHVKTEPGVNLGHARAGTAREWAGLLTRTGFRVERTEGISKSAAVRALTGLRPTLASAILFVALKR